MEWLCILLVCLLFAVRTSWFQNLLADQAASFFSKEWNTNVEIGKLDIVFFDRVYLNHVYLEDLKGDTLGYFSSLDVNVDRLDFENNQIYLDNVTLNNPLFKLKKYQTDSTLNLQFIIDYFKKEEPDTSKSQIDFRIHTVALNNGSFMFWDEHSEVSEKGMDYKHLDLKGIHCLFENFQLKGDTIKVGIQKLTATDRCGLILRDFKSKAVVSPKGIHLKSIEIATNQSKIFAEKLHMNTASWGAYKNYINEVYYDGKVQSSEVYVSDVAYFAPVLWGSNERIVLSSNVQGNILNMKFRDFKAKIGEETFIDGQFDMPKFTDFKSSDFRLNLRHIKTNFDAIEKIDLPDKWEEEPLRFDKRIKRLGNLNLSEITIDGNFDRFVLTAKDVETNLGNIDLMKGLTFNYDHVKKMYTLGKDGSSPQEVNVRNFDLGAFLGNKLFGKVSGKINVASDGLDPKNLDLALAGKVSSFDFKGYRYKNISIENGQLTNDQFTGKLKMDDPNAQFVFDGTIKYKDGERAKFTMDAEHLDLSKLGLVSEDSMEVSFNSSFDVNNFDLDELDGRIAFYNILLKRKLKEFVSDSLVLNIDRLPKEDIIIAQSDMLDGKLQGKIYPNTFISSIIHKVATVFPSYFGPSDFVNTKRDSEFKYHVILSDKCNDLFDVFVPGLTISKGTKFIGNYHGKRDEFDMFFLSNEVHYNEYVFSGIDFYNQIGDSSLFIDNQISDIKLNDSLSFKGVSLSSLGNHDTLKTQLRWGNVGDLSTHPGILSFNAEVKGKRNFELDMGNSFFYMNKHKWEVSDRSKVFFVDSVFEFEKVKFSHKDQYISINGKLSESKQHRTLVNVHDFNLSDINNIFGGELDINGIMNGQATIAAPTTDMILTGQFNTQNLKFDEYLLGNLQLTQFWDNDSNKFVLNGNLIKDSVERFNFRGNYYTKRKRDPLDVILNFDYTDISFVNAVLPTDAIENIRGYLSGNLRVHGTFENLILDGDVDLFAGNVKVSMLGVNFGMSGKVHSDKYGFFIDKMPVFDEEGNAGYMYGSIYHDHFRNWNFSADVNLEDDYFKPRGYLYEPLDKFLLMNTPYSEGASFYGKAYGTGRVSVFGYAENMEFDVSIKTQEGTDFYLPIFSSGDLEQDDFVVFIDKDSTKNEGSEQEVDLTGISLNLNFEVNEDANINILLDETGENQLRNVTGNGNIQIGLDQLNDLYMAGDYFITSGKCEVGFASLVEKKFDLVQGGVVSWAGNPYEAVLDVTANYSTHANPYEAVPSLLEEKGSTGKTNVNCALKLDESLMEPKIHFGIEIPNAQDDVQDILSRIVSNEDELNKQFFSLLLLNKFQPMSGETGSGGSSSTVGNLLSSKINDLLDDISEDFKIGVGIDSKDDLSSGDFTLNTEFALDPKKRLTLKTSLGYSNNVVGDEHVSSLIGDVVLEYKLNKQGSFRVNVFNESNDYQTIQDKKLGNFTQGAGLYYTESFNSAKDFKLLQHFLNIFRKNKRKDLNPDKEKKKEDIPEDKKYLLEEYLNKKKKRKTK